MIIYTVSSATLVGEDGDALADNRINARKADGALATAKPAVVH